MSSEMCTFRDWTATLYNTEFWDLERIGRQDVVVEAEYCSAQVEARRDAYIPYENNGGVVDLATLHNLPLANHSGEILVTHINDKVSILVKV